VSELATKEDIMRLERQLAEMQKVLTERLDDLLHAVWQSHQHRQGQQDWRQAQEAAAAAGLAPAVWDEAAADRGEQG
jgi:hypothetical protein